MGRKLALLTMITVALLMIFLVLYLELKKHGKNAETAKQQEHEDQDGGLIMVEEELEQFIEGFRQGYQDAHRERQDDHPDQQQQERASNAVVKSSSSSTEGTSGNNGTRFRQQLSSFVQVLEPIEYRILAVTIVFLLAGIGCFSCYKKWQKLSGQQQHQMQPDKQSLGLGLEQLGMDGGDSGDAAEP